MTQLNDKSGSQDIADHLRRCEGFAGRLDNYSRGLPLDHLPAPPPPQCNEPERPRLHIRWLVAWAIGFAVAGFVAAVAFGDVPDRYGAPRGYDVCTTKGC